MLRLRFAALVAALGFGLICGCLSFSRPPILDRFRGKNDCCEVGAVPENATFVEQGPSLAAPGGPPCAAPAGPIPQGTIPDLSQPPRLVPQPQSPTESYRPPQAKFTKTAPDPKFDR